MENKPYLVVFKITGYKGFKTGEWSDQIQIECSPANLERTLKDEKAKLERKVNAIVGPAKERLGGAVGVSVTISQVLPL